MNYVVDKVKEEQKEDVSILTHPLFYCTKLNYFAKLWKKLGFPFTCTTGPTTSFVSGLYV